MVPKESGINQSDTTRPGHDFRLMRTHIVTFSRLVSSHGRDGEVKQSSIFIIMETQFAIQSQVM